MSKILCILMALLALGAVIDCKVGVQDGNSQPDICSIIGCVTEQQIIRNKRANGRAVEILGGVESLVTGILKANWDGIERVKAQRRKKTIVIGPGKHNKNTKSTWGHVERVKKHQGEERVIIGGGSYNDNTVVLDDSDYE